MKNFIKFWKSFYYMHINLLSYSQQFKLMNLLHTTKILYFKSQQEKNWPSQQKGVLFGLEYYKQIFAHRIFAKSSILW